MARVQRQDICHSAVVVGTVATAAAVRINFSKCGFRTFINISASGAVITTIPTIAFAGKAALKVYANSIYIAVVLSRTIYRTAFVCIFTNSSV